MMKPDDRDFVLDLVRQGHVPDPLLVVSVNNAAARDWTERNRLTAEQVVQIRGKDDLLGHRRGAPWVLITGTDPDVPEELRLIAQSALGEDTLLEVV